MVNEEDDDDPVEQSIRFELTITATEDLYNAIDILVLEEAIRSHVAKALNSKTVAVDVQYIDD